MIAIAFGIVAGTGTITLLWLALPSIFFLHYIFFEVIFIKYL